MPYENCGAPQEDLFRLRKMVMAPVQRGPQRQVPWISISPTEFQEIEPRTEPRCRIPDAENGGPSGSELDRQRDAIQLTADFSNAGSVIVP